MPPDERFFQQPHEPILLEVRAATLDHRLPLRTAGLGEEARAALLRQIPLHCLGQPADVANAALFLASPAARYITGQVLAVDGGLAM